MEACGLQARGWHTLGNLGLNDENLSALFFNGHHLLFTPPSLGPSVYEFAIGFVWSEDPFVEL